MLKDDDDHALEKPDDSPSRAMSFVGQTSRSLSNLAASPGMRDKGKFPFVVRHNNILLSHSWLPEHQIRSIPNAAARWSVE